MSTPGWEHFPCGCLMQSTGQPDAVAWKACPLHAQAEGMHHLIRQIAEGRQHIPSGQDGKALDELERDARAILRAVEGRVTP